MTGARDQVTRMLALVPYLRSHEGIPVEQVAKDFGVTTAQVVKDLNVLWFCGLPGAVTGEMIDVDMEALESEGVVYIDNAEFLGRPLRLTPQEALSLIVALRTLRAATTEGRRGSIDSALAKLEAAAGDGSAAPGTVSVLVEEIDPTVQETIRAALDEGRRLRLSYLVPSRDEQTDRQVDPLRVVTGEGRPYLEAWCFRADDVRLFRFDRIAAVELLDEPVAEHDVEPRDLSAGLFHPDESSVGVTLDLLPHAHWIAEYYSTDEVEERGDGVLRVRMRVGDPAWLRRLVLRQGGDARIVDPDYLADDVRSEAERARAAY